MKGSRKIKHETW